MFQLSGPVCKSTWIYTSFLLASHLYFMFHGLISCPLKKANISLRFFNFQDLYASLLGYIHPFFLLLTFISCFMDWFLVHWKRLIFLWDCYRWLSPPYSHILYTKMLHFVWQSISAIYIVQPGSEGRKTYTQCACEHTHVQSLTSHSNIMRRKKIMTSSEDIFNCIDCSKARRHV